MSTRDPATPVHGAPTPPPTSSAGLIHDGRPVLTRAEVAALAGVAGSTAERWYRERATTGHPDPVHRHGRRLFFDAGEVIAWVREFLARDDAAARVVEGRRVLSRAELVTSLGVTEQTLARLYTQRATTGHPEAVHRAGRRLFFDEAEMTAWARAWEQTKQAGLTEIDRSGDPEELVDIDEAARVLGYANRRTIDSYLARRGRGYFPEPDDPDRRRWHRRTVWGFAQRRSRPGRNGHTRAGAPDPAARGRR